MTATRADAASRRGPRRPWQVSLAITLLALGASVLVVPAVRVVLAVMNFGVPFPDTLSTAAFRELTLPLLIPAAILAVVAFGLWRRWRAAHAAGVALAAVGLASNAVPFVSAFGEFDVPIIAATVGIALAFACLVASWRWFWRRDAQSAP